MKLEGSSENEFQTGIPASGEKKISNCALIAKLHDGGWSRMPVRCMPEPRHGSSETHPLVNSFEALKS